MIAIAVVVLLCGWLAVGAAIGVILGRVIARADRLECGGERRPEPPARQGRTVRQARRPADGALAGG